MSRRQPLPPTPSQRRPVGFVIKPSGRWWSVRLLRERALGETEDYQERFIRAEGLSFMFVKWRAHRILRREVEKFDLQHSRKDFRFRMSSPPPPTVPPRGPSGVSRPAKR